MLLKTSKSTLFFIFIVLLTNAVELFAQSYQTPVNKPIDIKLQSKSNIDKPFEVSVGALFIDSEGIVKKIDGFYNGNDEYVIRFLSTEAGEFSYTTYSSDPKMAGIEGLVEVKNQAVNPLRGQIVIDKNNPQKLAYENGDPYFALAFELDWLFALDYKNETGQLPKSNQILESVKENGFNQVVMNVYAYDVGWPTQGEVPAEYSFKKPNYSVFEGTNENPDFDKLNIDFFKHLDSVMELLQEKGIVSHLMIYVWNKKVNWPEMYSEADNRFFDYVIKRYQAYPNLIWDVSKEALDYGRCDIPYINERIARIRKNDTYNHLVTVHDYEYCSREPQRVDIISIQNWRSNLYSQSMEAYQLYTDKPVMNIEHGGYEEGPFTNFPGNYTDPKVCLERNYQCIFAGLYSTYYWQNSSWDVVIYDALQNDKYPKPRFDYYKPLQVLFTEIDFNSLQVYKPKLTINSRLGNDNMATSGYALTDDKGLYLYYVPKENFQLNVVVPKGEQGKYLARWFNIFTGEFTDVMISDYQMFKSYQSPWKGESAVLVLKSK
ncbi:apiosidase-like domain-containing protein [Jiulongibacter sp. NS-SX5]|uniref:apiosidase-like domain-containing protein n=1 Tax=Jiulongibacter sp. NS-SX5 TaxID=3463854 RepID=UPI0040581A85